MVGDLSTHFQNLPIFPHNLVNAFLVLVNNPLRSFSVILELYFDGLCLFTNPITPQTAPIPSKIKTGIIYHPDFYALNTLVLPFDLVMTIGI